ncbi:hypothetical protein SADUNF_Sadunf19G0004900 [Salix dunnii]|uniref:Uncharacterized protein n=1 Tax=Salix dunnii TaxID=1413687 RepID=A0A835J2I2_9ROSI|nr:hypothetical protein SADUNF_Sadunf19G0004900 [Salix dunnii]
MKLRSTLYSMKQRTKQIQLCYSMEVKRLKGSGILRYLLTCTWLPNIVRKRLGRTAVSKV